MTHREWPDIAGRLLEGGHVLPVRIYYEDTDFSGLVYHAGYLRFMERGRSDFLRLIGVGHGALAAEEGSPGFAVRRMAIEFHRPARMDDLVEVETKLAELTGSRIILAQRVLREDHCLAEAEVTVAIVDKTGRPRRIPTSIRDHLKGLTEPLA